jgi:hypothetical protein
MAISFVGSMAPVGANNGGNVTLTFTGASGLLDAAGAQASLQQGDVVVVAYASSGTADAAMSTSSSLWNEIHEGYANGSSNDTNLALYYKVMGAVPDTSFVAVGPTGNNNGTIATAFAFRGVDAAVLDIAFVAGSHFATGTGTTLPNAPAITPSTAGAWIVVAGAGAAAAGATYANSDLSSTTNHFRTLNHAESIDIAIGMGIKTNWASGAFDPAAWTGGATNAGDSWAAIVVALKPAPITHTSTGTLTGQIGSVAGTAAHKARHTTTGGLTGQGSAIAGTSVHKARHTTSGTLTGQIGSVAGSAARTRQHAATGGLAGPGSTIAASAARERIHPSSGALVGLGASVIGSGARSGGSVTHETNGILLGDGSIILAIVAHEALVAVARRTRNRRRRNAYQNWNGRVGI